MNSALAGGGKRRGGQAKTHRGQSTQRPDGVYAPKSQVEQTIRGLTVTVIGEDRRSRTFKLHFFPLPLWHQPLAEAFARCTGPHGTRRTVASAGHLFFKLKKFLVTLSELPHPPQTPADLTARHLEIFWLQQRAATGDRHAHHDVRSLRQVFLALDDDAVSPEIQVWFDRRRIAGPARETLGGYSDREFDAIMAAARSEVVAIRGRLERSQRLLTTFREDPSSLSIEEQKLATMLTSVAATGIVPPLRHRAAAWAGDPMMEVAQQLFVVDWDLGPLVALAVGLSGRNSETIKELSASHEVLEERAVRLELIKRRRGPGSMFETIHWEVGSPSQQLQRPGGFYLLLEQMMRPSRSFCGTTSLWAVWSPRTGHGGAFDVGLHLKAWSMAKWKQRHPILDDDGEPLFISLPRLKKTVDVRNTRATGGHLPSSVRSNSMPVLFKNYLRGDASVKEWAGDVITGALDDAVNDARISCAKVVTARGGQPLEPDEIATRLQITSATAESLVEGKLDTAFVACADIDHSPFDDGARCTASFLMCFGCQNALVSHAHIPQLKALLQWLLDQRTTQDLDGWWQRHGLTYLAITEHIRPKFTAEEWESPPAADDVAGLLDFIDGPQEPT